MKTVVFDRMEECTEPEVQRMLPLVNAQRREQALRYKHTFGRFCCLKSWLMLKELLDISIQNSEFLYNEHGKPFFERGPYFSISHCKEGIAVVVDDKPVGIDIECIRHADEELIQRVMCADENQKLMAQCQSFRDRAFTRLWTQKEAIVKAQGTGIESFEQLQAVLHTQLAEFSLQTVECEKYIYTIAYKKV